MNGPVHGSLQGQDLSATALALALGLAIGCAQPIPAQSEAPSTSERDLDLRLREWFALLESHTPGERPVARLVSGPPLELALAGQDTAGAVSLHAWLDELRSPYPSVEFRVTLLQVTRASTGARRVRFLLDRRAVDREGLPHVARWNQLWWIEDRGSSAPRVVRIEEQASPAFPGTGSRIICN